MTIPFAETAFIKGEISPAMWGRVDTSQLHIGATTMRNIWPSYRGGAYSRAGTRYVGACKQPAGPPFQAPVLRPFTFNVNQSYVLEFGDLYMRVIANGGYVLEPGFPITAISNANPMAVTAVGNNFAAGDWVVITGAGGMIQANNTFVVGSTPVPGTTFTTQGVFSHAAVNSTGFPAYTSGGTVARIFTLPTPYTSLGDLTQIKIAQSADVVSIVHPQFAPMELSRFGPAAWSLAPLNVGAALVAPTNVTATLNTASAPTTNTGYSYVVTAVDASGNESIASAAGNLTSTIDIAITPGSITVSWTASAGAASYNIYKAPPSYDTTVPAGSLYGFIATATGTAYVDGNVTPDFAQTPPLHQNPFANTNNPSAVSYFQQRRVYANTTTSPDTMYFSQPGHFTDFDSRLPVIDSDAITARPWGFTVDGIQWMIPMPAGLVVLTGRDAWQVSGAGSTPYSVAPLTPSSVVATPQSFNGVATTIPPVRINFEILFVQVLGNRVRDLSYQFFQNIYTGIDLTIWNDHLFNDFLIKDWAWVEEPHKLLWAIRDNGTMLSLTFLKEQEVVGWARHDTNGLFKAVTSIVEPPVNALYTVVQRSNKFGAFFFLERMDDRIWDSVEEAWCVDGALQTLPIVTLESDNVGYSGTTGTVTFTQTNTPGVFTSAMIGNTIRLNGGIATITAFVSSQVVMGTWILSPDQIGNPVQTFTIWQNVTTVRGLDQFEGTPVYGLADGTPIGPLTVTGGAVTLPFGASLVTLGLPFLPQLQSVYLDDGQPTSQGRRKDLFAVTVRLDGSAGFSLGTNQPDASAIRPQPSPGVAWTGLTTVATTAPNGTAVPYTNPNTNQTITPLYTGDCRALVQANWQKPGQIALQQNQPLPLSVTALIPEYLPGDLPEVMVTANRDQRRAP